MIILFLMVNHVAHAQRKAKKDSTWIQSPEGCLIHNPYPEGKESITWTGDCKDGYASGQGTLTWFKNGKKGQQYTGGMEKGSPSGQGIYDFGGGYFETGNYSAGKLNGKASTFTLSDDGDTLHYTLGEHKDGRREGMGMEVYFDTDGDTSMFYRGNYENNQATGEGYREIHYARGYKRVQTGNFLAQEFSGKGEEWQDLFGRIMEHRVGTFPWSKFNGKGTITNGKNTFEGDFKNGKKEGFGILTYEGKPVYEGSWKDDKMHGVGKRVLLDGSIYYGEFRDGRPNGFGVICWGKETYQQGEFVRGIYDGPGYRVEKGKSTMVGIWESGKLKIKRKLNSVRDRLVKRHKKKVEQYLINAQAGLD